MGCDNSAYTCINEGSDKKVFYKASNGYENNDSKKLFKKLRHAKDIEETSWRNSE